MPGATRGWGRGLLEGQRALRGKVQRDLGQGLGRGPQASRLGSQLVPMHKAAVTPETTVCFFVDRTKLGRRVHGAGPPSR